MFDPELVNRAAALLAAYRAAGLKIVTAESCTGGLLAALLTEVAGCSAVIERGFVTYSNHAKHEMLGVPCETIAAYGAVSPQTALAMARGALAHSAADVALSVTGIAGPGGGTPVKPVGLVHFGVATRHEEAETLERRFVERDRGAVRAAALEQAVSLLEGIAARRSAGQADP